MSEVFRVDPGPQRRTRLVVLGLVAALLGAFAAAGSALGEEESSQLPSVSTAGHTQAWFCPLTVPSGTVAISNVGAQGTGELVVLSSDSAAQQVVEFPANQTKTIGPSDLVGGAPAGVSLRTPAQGIAVTHRYDDTSAPVNCQNSAETQLVFTDNTTSAGAATTVGLFNPFFDPAVVDISFHTDVGTVLPKSLEGVVIGPRSLRLVATGAEIPRREWITTIVKVRSGRIAGESTQTTERGESDRFIAPPAPQPRSSWFSPPADPAAAGNDVISVTNVAPVEVGVRVSVSAANNSAIEPFELRVPAEGRVQLDLRNEARIPRDAALEVRVEGVDRAEVIASRSIPGEVVRSGDQRWAYLEPR